MSVTVSEENRTGGADESVRQYLKDISQYPRLTPEQEQALAKGCSAGDADAIRQMVNANLRLVVSIAWEYVGRGAPLLDMIQEGSIGLLAAAAHFDYTMQCRFSTYATKWIRQGIHRYLLEQDSPIRIPRHTAEQMRKLRQTRRELAAQLLREPTEEELASRMEISLEQVKKLQARLPQIYSLDAPAGEQDEALQSFLENQQTPQPQQILVRQELEKLIRQMLEALTPRQQQVLRLRFGMDQGICHTYDEIGAQLGVSKQRARQIEAEAIAKLKKQGADLGLEDYLE